MEIVDFAYREAALPPGPNLSGRGPIFDKLRARDLRPVVSLRAESAFTSDGLQVHELVMGGAETLGEEEFVPLATVGLIVNRVGRSIKLGDLPEGTLLPPLINENRTRALAHRKHLAYGKVLQPLGLGIPTRLVTGPDDVEAFMTEHDAGTFIVKPDGGTNSLGVKRISREAVAQLFADDEALYTGQIIQPALDFTVAFPTGIRPYDVSSRQAFEAWNRPGFVKEMRMYGFHSPAGTEVFPVCRAIQNGDQWFFLDPDSVPEQVHEAARQGIAKAAEVTGAAALLGTIDSGYGTLGQEEPAWHVIEMNAKAPYVIGYDKHIGVADKLRELLADQIHATVVSGTNSS